MSIQFREFTGDDTNPAGAIALVHLDGGHSGYFRDPDGHLWEVIHNPDRNHG